MYVRKKRLSSGMCFLCQSKCVEEGKREGDGEEGGTNVPNSRSTYKNNLHMHRGNILLRRVTCNSGKEGPLSVGSPGGDGGRRDEGERDGEGEGQGRRRGGPEQFNGALI